MTDASNQYHIVIEYADGGTLREYLAKNFGTLSWIDRYKLSLDITNGLKYMHDMDIHKDLVLRLFVFIKD